MTSTFRSFFSFPENSLDSSRGRMQRLCKNRSGAFLDIIITGPEATA